MSTADDHTANGYQPRWFAYHRPTEFSALCEQNGLAVRDVVVSHRRDWFMVTAARAR